MTVKETLAMLDHPEKVSISWFGDLVSFNFRNDIEVEAWGDYLVDRICAVEHDDFELVLSARPVKKGATA